MDKSNPKAIEELRNIPGEFPINIYVSIHSRQQFSIKRCRSLLQHLIYNPKP